MRSRGTDPRSRRPFLAFQFLTVFGTQLFSGAFRVGDLRELDGLTRHDRRYRVFIDELRVSIPAQKNTEIIEPGYNALELDAVHEKNGQWCLVLANMVEKSVL